MVFGLAGLALWTLGWFCLVQGTKFRLGIRFSVKGPCDLRQRVRLVEASEVLQSRPESTGSPRKTLVLKMLLGQHRSCLQTVRSMWNCPEGAPVSRSESDTSRRVWGPSSGSSHMPQLNSFAVRGHSDLKEEIDSFHSLIQTSYPREPVTFLARAGKSCSTELRHHPTVPATGGHGSERPRQPKRELEESYHGSMWGLLNSETLESLVRSWVFRLHVRFGMGLMLSSAAFRALAFMIPSNWIQLPRHTLLKQIPRNIQVDVHFLRLFYAAATFLYADHHELMSVLVCV